MGPYVLVATILCCSLEGTFNCFSVKSRPKTSMAGRVMLHILIPCCRNKTRAEMDGCGSLYSLCADISPSTCPSSSLLAFLYTLSHLRTRLIIGIHTLYSACLLSTQSPQPPPPASSRTLQHWRTGFLFLWMCHSFKNKRIQFGGYHREGRMVWCICRAGVVLFLSGECKVGSANNSPRKGNSIHKVYSVEKLANGRMTKLTWLLVGVWKTIQLMLKEGTLLRE